MDSIKTFLNFDCDLFVERVGLSEGHGLFRNNDINVSSIGYSSGHIDIFVSLANSILFILLVFLKILTLS